MGRLRDLVTGRPWDQMMGRSRDIRGTLITHVFSNSIYKDIKLTLIGYSQQRIVEAKNSVNSTMVKKII